MTDSVSSVLPSTVSVSAHVKKRIGFRANATFEASG